MKFFSQNFSHRLQTSSCFRWKLLRMWTLLLSPCIPLHEFSSGSAWLPHWYHQQKCVFIRFYFPSPLSPSASHVVNNSHRSSLKDFTVNLWPHELRFIFPKEIYAESDHVTSWNRKEEITLSTTMISETYPLHLMQGYCESGTDNASASYVRASSGDFESDGNLKFDLWEARPCSFSLLRLAYVSALEITIIYRANKLVAAGNFSTITLIIILHHQQRFF